MPGLKNQLTSTVRYRRCEGRNVPILLKNSIMIHNTPTDLGIGVITHFSQVTEAKSTIMGRLLPLKGRYLFDRWVFQQYLPLADLMGSTL